MGKEDLTINSEKINRIWHVVRPFWTVMSGLILMVIICTLNWQKVSGYDSRLIALELWRIETTKTQSDQVKSITDTQAIQSKDIAVVKQQVEDIHDYLIPDKVKK